jgi:WD40 repeat protein
MDISYDSKLIVTCSADKNVKIWGLDFGDCHKSIFAHDESITQVAFEKESHCFWTVSKDKMLKYWDGDKVGVFLICPRPITVTGSVASLGPTLFSSSRRFRRWRGITVRFGPSP